MASTAAKVAALHLKGQADGERPQTTQGSGYAGQAPTPFNLAFCRIDPRGTCDRNSLKRYCLGCTRIAVKIGYAQLQPFLARIVTEASTETDADGLRCAALPKPPTTLHGDDTDALM